MSEKQKSHNPLMPPADIPAQEGGFREKVIAVLEDIYDPEIPVNIWELGLIYDINVSDNNAVHIKMTLTSPACPVAGLIVTEVEKRIRSIQGVGEVQVEMVWDPPWEKEKMSEAAKLQLGFL